MRRKILNEVKAEFPAKSVNEGLARVIAAALVSQLDPTLDEMADLKTAVSEAVTNCIVHAYKEKAGVVKLRAAYYEGRIVRVRVKDEGGGIADVHKAMEPLYTTDASGERSGMGFAIMGSFTDKLRVTSKPGKGTTVIFEKKLAEHGRY